MHLFARCSAEKDGLFPTLLGWWYCQDLGLRLIPDTGYLPVPVRADGSSVCLSVAFQCLDGRVYTRTEIGEPTGTALTSLYKISTSHRTYKPPVGLRQKYPSTEGYREPWKTVLCVSDRPESGAVSGPSQLFFYLELPVDTGVILSISTS